MQYSRSILYETTGYVPDQQNWPAPVSQFYIEFYKEHINGQLNR